MASPRLKTDSQETALMFVRVLAFFTVIFIVGLATWLIAFVAGVPQGIAAAAGGSLAGVVGFLILAFGSMFEERVFTCPNCQHTDKTLRRIGYYNCFNCGTEYRIWDKEVRVVGEVKGIELS